METKPFSDVITFTRSTTGTFLNPVSGFLETAAIDVPRIEVGGLLFEQQRVNLALRSNDFSNAAWTKTNTSVATGAVLGPDGTPAYRLTENAANGTHLAIQNGKVVTGNTKYCRSVFARADSAGRFAYLDTASIGNWANVCNVTFDLINGVVTTVNGTPDAYGMEPWPNGWYRCWLVATTIASPAAVPMSIFITKGGVTTYTGDGTSGIYIFGAQFEAGDGPSSYVPSVAATVTRAADLAFVLDSDWLNLGEGTLFIEANHSGSVASGAEVQMSRLGTATLNSGRIVCRITSGLSAGHIVNDAMSTVFGQSLGSAVPAGATLKQALAYRTDDVQFSSGGLISPVDTSADMPTVGRLTLGSVSTGAGRINGRIRRIKYFPYRLTAAQLQALTT